VSPSRRSNSRWGCANDGEQPHARRICAAAS
jgi:hypothetical protein